jgi:hypothetical protein
MRKTFWLLVGLPITIFYSIKIVWQLKLYWWPELQIEAKYGFIFLLLVLLGVYAHNVYLTFRHARNSKYGEALNTITSGFASIHDLNRIPEDQLTYDLVKQYLKDMCTNISYAMTIITGYKISCCIKVMVPTGNGDYKLTTICRDNHDGITRNKPDQKEGHYLNENSDFKTLYNDIKTGKSRFFISNKLNWLGASYENSSFESYGGKPKFTGVPFLDFFLLLKLTIWWPLPYKGTIIVPIIPIHYKPTDEILGFLCVDCKNMFVFRRYYDVDLLTGLADGIYNTVNLIHSLTKK